MTVQPRRLRRAMSSRRFAGLALADGAAWALGLAVGSVLRYDFDLSRIDVVELVKAMALVAAVQVATGIHQGLYLGRWRLGSFHEVRAMGTSVVLALAALATVNVPLRLVPLSAMIGGAFVALVVMLSYRYTWRMASIQRLLPSATSARRTLVFGAGEGGDQVLAAMLSNPLSPFLPVVLADDDPHKAELRLRGVPVRGDRRAIPRLAQEHDCEVLLVAVPSASAELIREVSALGSSAGLEVRVLPPVSELFDATVRVGDIRPVTPQDLLGRREIDTDVDSIADYVFGKRVLVTGAGGSIGSELCRQLRRFGPAELVMLDRDESALHAVQLSIDGRALLDTPDLVVADIRDRARMAEIIRHHRPQVIFHAAALKHLPLLEMHPREGLKTNVVATSHLLELAAASGVEHFVNISTDKAANPSSVLGWTKRITERLTAGVASRTPGTFMSVRFGNVLGSRGSVLTAFRSQIDAGGPVTVTHPDVTRYFMTIEEAVQLVIQAGAIGGDGEVLVLDMGAPVRIADVARQLVEQADRPVEIVYTGLRGAEKLHEDLLGDDEVAISQRHPLIMHVEAPTLDPTLLDELLAADESETATQLARVATSPSPRPPVELERS